MLHLLQAKAFATLVHERKWQKEARVFQKRILFRWLQKILNLYFDAWVSQVDDVRGTAHVDSITTSHGQQIAQKDADIDVLKQQHDATLKNIIATHGQQLVQKDAEIDVLKQRHDATLEKLETVEKPLQDALNLTSRTLELTSNRLGQRDSAIDRMRSMITNLLETLSQDILNVPVDEDATGLHNRTTLGVLLNRCKIDRMALGGPAWKSKALKVGDEIVKVDGVKADPANIHTLLIGDDVPGSSVSITIKGDGWHGIGRTVQLKRMNVNAIADRVRMFELFTSMKIRAKEDDDTKAAALVDLSIDLWTAMLSAEAEHELKIASKVLQMQEACEAIASDMAQILTGTDNGDKSLADEGQRSSHDLGQRVMHNGIDLHNHGSHETERKVIQQLQEQAPVTFGERHHARELVDALHMSTHDRRHSGGGRTKSPRREQMSVSMANVEPEYEDADESEQPSSGHQNAGHQNAGGPGEGSTRSHETSLSISGAVKTITRGFL